jgi:NADH-quinone oxidoreductase subunit F
MASAHRTGRHVGRATALFESFEGKKGQPRFKPPFSASYLACD